MKNVETSKLVGMYALFIKEEKIKARIHIMGKAGDNHFICHVISPLTGEGNIAIILNLEDLRHWVILPTQDLAQEILSDYYANGWRYGVDLT